MFKKSFVIITVLGFTGSFAACERTKKIDLDQQQVTLQLQKEQEQQPQEPAAQVAAQAAQTAPTQPQTEPASGAAAPH